MDVERIVQPAYCVIGHEGSTADGEGFVMRLWQLSNERFAEAAHLAKREADGRLHAAWGCMSALDRSFAPWEDFDKGLYLAGFEALPDVVPPEGWVRWDVPGYEAIREPAGEGAFAEALKYLESEGLELVLAQQDYTDTATGRNYLVFPIRRL